MPRRIDHTTERRILDLYHNEGQTMDAIVQMLKSEGRPVSRTTIARRLAEDKARRTERQRLEDHVTRQQQLNQQLKQALPPAQQVDTTPAPVPSNAQTSSPEIEALRLRIRSLEARVTLLEDRS